MVLDEPTSVLAPQEVEALFEVVRGMRGSGYGVVIVTHKLNEVRQIADRVTVLRAGRVVRGGTRLRTTTPRWSRRWSGVGSRR